MASTRTHEYGEIDPFQVHLTSESVQYSGTLGATRANQTLLKISRHNGAIEMDLSRHIRESLSMPSVLSSEAIDNLVKSGLSSSSRLLMLWKLEALFLPSIPVTSSVGSIYVFQGEPNQLRRPGIATARP